MLLEDDPPQQAGLYTANVRLTSAKPSNPTQLNILPMFLPVMHSVWCSAC